MDAIEITPVPTDDAAALTAWNDTMRRAYEDGREAVFWRSTEATVVQFATPPRPGVERILLAAHLDGRLVGGAEVTAETGEPTEVEIGVLPEARRRGVGRALVAGVVERLGGSTDPWQVEVYTDGGVAFGRAAGLEVAHAEGRLVADLPLDAGRLDELAARHPVADDVEIASWVGACPDEHIEAWAALTQQMDEDVPMGDLTRRSSRFGDVEAVRRNEQRMDAQGYDLVRSLALVDGTPVGYTLIFVSRPDPAIVLQDDTLVDRAHRGRGIGWALKVANLRQLASLPSARESRWLQTWTADTNTGMLRLNERLGFRRADTLTEMEGRPSL